MTSEAEKWGRVTPTERTLALMVELVRRGKWADDKPMLEYIYACCLAYGWATLEEP